MLEGGPKGDPMRLQRVRPTPIPRYFPRWTVIRLGIGKLRARERMRMADTR